MSSREIADLTGKQHAHVIRDIRNLLAALGDDPNLDHVIETKDARGYTDHFALPKRETLILVSGYDPVMRAKIIDRWMELERQVAQTVPAIPKTFAEALRLAAGQAEQVPLHADPA